MHKETASAVGSHASRPSSRPASVEEHLAQRPCLACARPLTDPDASNCSIEVAAADRHATADTGRDTGRL